MYQYSGKEGFFPDASPVQYGGSTGKAKLQPIAI